ncbi:MAG TPA: hypothetical protein VMY42_07950, partial [Thermoguttaceae bacterium]|nr:hypothetical protein [Thermoguttaceae bacterium]
GEAYAWAIANPGKVSCVYARNPYMHSLMAGNAQPIDNLAALAKAGVPPHLSELFPRDPKANSPQDAAF